MAANIENLVHAIAGAGGGIISMTLTYPLITIGTRMQTSHGKQTFTDSLLKTYKKEGIAGLYSGLDTAVFGIAVTNGVYYYWYEIAKKAFEKHGKLSIAESLLAGGLAGAATVLVTNPIWVLNTRLASGKGNKSIDEDSPSSSQEQLVKDQSAFDVLLSIIREEGVQSLWQGVWPALILVANPSIQYMAFEQLKQLMTDKWRALNSFDYFLLGAVSKLAATFITYPYIVVKSRMQLKQKHKISTYEALRKIINDEGIAGLYKGLGSKLAQSVLTAAILFWAKESLVDVTREALIFIMSLSTLMKAKKLSQ